MTRSETTYAWQQASINMRAEASVIARAIRLGDEARGLRVVPVEATESMINAGGAAMDHPNIFMGGSSRAGKRRAARAYRAMISASPFSKEFIQ